MKWEVTLWPNNQLPILVGYYEANSSMGAKVKASKEMTKDGCPIDPKDENLSVVRKSNNTSYQKYVNPPVPSLETLIKRLKRKFSNGKR